jgi:hypothetical protein
MSVKSRLSSHVVVGTNSDPDPDPPGVSGADGEASGVALVSCCAVSAAAPAVVLSAALVVPTAKAASAVVVGVVGASVAASVVGAASRQYTYCATPSSDGMLPMHGAVV